MEEYVSIVVPYFNRIHYLKELIESAHKFANMPFELIIHDDSSVDGSTPELFNMRDEISTLVVNSGHNIGLPASVNRLVNIASSNYIIFLNCDCAFVSRCFENIVEILSRPYVGVIHLSNSIQPELKLHETRINLVGLQSGSSLAFRKEVWKEVGGWNENVHSGSSDASFIHSIFSKGYFAATPRGKKYVSNLSYERVQNRDSAMAASGYDCSYPKIFNLKKDFEGYDRYCKLREHLCNQHANSIINVPASITNLTYWCNYINKMLFDKPEINWDIARLHCHDKWKNEIEEDKNTLLSNK